MAVEDSDETYAARKPRQPAPDTFPPPPPLDGTVTGSPADFTPTLRPQAVAEFPSQLGAYRLSRKLGEGGMGAVFLAEDLTLHRQVALKVMRPDANAGFESGQRFLREARSMAALKHDNIVTIYSVGEDKGIPFLAMELLKGTSLDAFLKSGRPLTTKSILRIGREIARGLGVAHAKGLVHRDIKPANIWLESPVGRVKILDFGIARPAAEADAITASGLVMGTPHYMSPEQARGEKVDGRADLFSLGVLLYRMATGKVPFEGPTLMSVLMAIGTATPPSAAEIKLETPPKLSQLIDRLIAKKRDDRPANAEAVAAELSHIEKELGRETTAMVIDDVLPIGDHPRGPRDDRAEMTEAARPANRTDKAPAAPPEVDEQPEVVPAPAPKKKRKRKKAPRQSLFPLYVGVGVLLMALALLIGWRATHRTPTSSTTPTAEPKSKPTLSTEPTPDETPKTDPVEPPPKFDPPTKDDPERPKFDPPPKKDFPFPKKDFPFPKKDFPKKAIPLADTGR